MAKFLRVLAWLYLGLSVFASVAVWYVFDYLMADLMVEGADLTWISLSASTVFQGIVAWAILLGISMLLEKDRPRTF